MSSRTLAMDLPTLIGTKKTIFTFSNTKHEFLLLAYLVKL